MNGLQRRLSKLEELRHHNDGEREVDIELERMGTSRAAVLADFGSLIAFRDWLAARIAATDHQAGVPMVTHYRQRQFDCEISEKWNAIFERHEALQTAAPAACFSHPKEVLQ